MRNGDYTPNRMEACKDSLLYLAKRKLDGNQETAVGIMCGGGTTYSYIFLNVYKQFSAQPVILEMTNQTDDLEFSISLFFFESAKTSSF